ncbi:AbrB/MazE/SpoVT family DNA-binding domain-containing protein [Ramlibacter albus]|uniref:ChpB-ChpS toxin-antitoxin system antitoxin n=1 Tax=Ramlibacter albus TaxID=2079448 RepID=A0A923S6X0_9BURK|nr:ChpB-ChpS toxin-antitoxin system antitoxin [Ramlibacter albus]MBC5766582.1 ChpB-ChpS toxin-antitoxin system antitoxin [Ramlibacter albus]
MDVVLRKYGNSTVIALPPSLLKALNLRAGQSMSLDAGPDGTLTLAPKRRYSLAELLAQCDPKAPPPADLALWEASRPVGREVW